jgi:hypothetical protein
VSSSSCSVASEKDTPKKEIEVVETKPVERQIEARSVDDTFTGLVRCLSLVDCNLLSRELILFANANQHTLKISTKLWTMDMKLKPILDCEFLEFLCLIG